MRYDLLDEYSTLVPFGLGVSKHNRVIRSPDAPEPDLPQTAGPETCAGRTWRQRLAALLRLRAGGAALRGSH